jgi:hypothetical protein
MYSQIKKAHTYVYFIFMVTHIHVYAIFLYSQKLRGWNNNFRGITEGRRVRKIFTEEIVGSSCKCSKTFLEK